MANGPTGLGSTVNESKPRLQRASEFLPIQPLQSADTKRLIDRAQAVPSEVAARAAAIVADVRQRGDAALRHWTRELDGCDLADPFVSDRAWREAAAKVPKPLQAAIRRNLQRIEAFHQLQVGSAQTLSTAPGLKLGRFPVPLEAVACYVPGGRASYPSTALMTVAPARLAGVKRIVVVTPPRSDGSVDPVVLFAAKAAGATHVLRAGGAQAISALAYGTASIAAVQAIVGPGNAYVTAAKALVSSLVRTDAPAGPSELLILADTSAHADEVALDLLAQAEHDPDAQVILVSTSQILAQQVREELLRRLPATARAKIIEASLRDHGALFVAPDLASALSFSNAYAPEHLTLMLQAPRAALAQIRNAGSVFLGRHAPVSLGDYGSGTNHVLPTLGHARTRGGLGVEDFRKWVTWQEATPEGLRAIGADIAAVAHAEGLIAHAEAVEERLTRLSATPQRKGIGKEASKSAKPKQPSKSATRKQPSKSAKPNSSSKTAAPTKRSRRTP